MEDPPVDSADQAASDALGALSLEEAEASLEEAEASPEDVLGGDSGGDSGSEDDASPAPSSSGKPRASWINSCAPPPNPSPVSMYQAMRSMKEHERQKDILDLQQAREDALRWDAHTEAKRQAAKDLARKEKELDDDWNTEQASIREQQIDDERAELASLRQKHEDDQRIAAESLENALVLRSHTATFAPRNLISMPSNAHIVAEYRTKIKDSFLDRHEKFLEQRSEKLAQKHEERRMEEDSMARRSSGPPISAGSIETLRKIGDDPDAERTSASQMGRMNRLASPSPTRRRDRSASTTPGRSHKRPVTTIVMKAATINKLVNKLAVPKGEPKQRTRTPRQRRKAERTGSSSSSSSRPVDLRSPRRGPSPRTQVDQATKGPGRTTSRTKRTKRKPAASLAEQAAQARVLLEIVHSKLTELAHDTQPDSEPMQDVSPQTAHALFAHLDEEGDGELAEVRWSAVCRSCLHGSLHKLSDDLAKLIFDIVGTPEEGGVTVEGITADHLAALLSAGGCDTLIKLWVDKQPAKDPHEVIEEMATAVLAAHSNVRKSKRTTTKRRAKTTGRRRPKTANYSRPLQKQEAVLGNSRSSLRSRSAAPRSRNLMRSRRDVESYDEPVGRGSPQEWTNSAWREHRAEYRARAAMTPVSPRGRTSASNSNGPRRRRTTSRGGWSGSAAPSGVDRAEDFVDLRTNSKPAVETGSSRAARKKPAVAAHASGDWAPVAPSGMESERVAMIKHCANWVAARGPAFERVLR